jgi:hypothetical protein
MDRLIPSVVQAVAGRFPRIVAQKPDDEQKPSRTQRVIAIRPANVSELVNTIGV